MKTKKNAFIISLIVAIVLVTVGFFALADLIQWLVHFPDSFTYWAFNNRFLLMVPGTAALILAIVLNTKQKFMSKWLMSGFTLIYFVMFMSGFIAPPYIMFRSQHYAAEYVSIDQVEEMYLSDSDEVLVMEINGDARAYPNKWIVQ